MEDNNYDEKIKQLKKDKYKKKVKMLGRVALGNVCDQRGYPV